LIAAPFIWPTIYLLREHDPSERADRLLAVWPVLLVVSFVVAIVTIKRRRGISTILPFILIGAIHGAFMSQQLWGSTYAIWPLFIILLAVSIVELARLSKPAAWMTITLTVAIVASLLVSGGFYVWSHERLDYANLDEGEVKRSTLPQLKGLSVRGEWMPNFEELVRYTEREIPRDQGILILPGEDAFYYATGRRPRFPVLLFDHTVNPYSPDEILNICRERDIRWLIVKQDLQNEEEQVEQERDLLTAALEQEFEQVESLSNYDIYRRSDPDKKSADDDEPN
jgi:signal transduction histidine kinase